MDANDLMALQPWKGNNLSPFESFMVSEKSSKRPSGTAVAGIVVASAAAVVGIGAWIFGGVYAASRANGNKAVIDANAEHSRQMENLLANNLLSERNERVTWFQNQNPTLKDYITVTQSGSQNSAISNNALAQAEATLLTGALTGQMQSCPQKVSLYSAPQPCSCPGCSE